MKRVNLGSGISVPALLLVIAALLLAGCTKPSSVSKTGPSGDGVDDLFATLEGKATPAPGNEASHYAEQIHSAIQSHFYDAESYTGKQCALRIKLAPDGMLVDVRAESGDPELCRAAINAVVNTRFPKPPSQAVYDVYKNNLLEFRP